MWKSGMHTRFTEVSSNCHHGPTWGSSVPRLALVSIAPFGRPVVPDV